VFFAGSMLFGEEIDYEGLKRKNVGDNITNVFQSAQNWIRTSTPVKALRPEHSASTNLPAGRQVSPVRTMTAIKLLEILFQFRISGIFREYAHQTGFQRPLYETSGMADKVSLLRSYRIDVRQPVFQHFLLTLHKCSSYLYFSRHIHNT
jgi:hypothetical protein